MAHSSTSEPAVGQQPIDSPDAAAGSSRRQWEPDENEHGFINHIRSSKERRSVTPERVPEAQIPPRDAAFPAEGSGHLCNPTSQG